MIARRFLKRDFLDFRLYWIIVGIITVACAFLYAYYDAALNVLFPVYALWAMATMQHVLGSPWRTQHELSRHYLLALPIGHKRLFALQHLRILVFFAPFFALSGLYPFLSSMFQLLPRGTWLLYYLGILTSAGLVIEWVIFSTLEMERISSFLPRKERFGAYFKGTVIALFTQGILTLTWLRLLLPIGDPFRASPLWDLALSPQVVFPIGALLVIIMVPINTRKWCVTQ